MNKPYSIKIFLPGGDPDGLRTIEKSNWSGVGIVFPRALMGEVKNHFASVPPSSVGVRLSLMDCSKPSTTRTAEPRESRTVLFKIW
jgi:hypothetical protein